MVRVGVGRWLLSGLVSQGGSDAPTPVALGGEPRQALALVVIYQGVRNFAYFRTPSEGERRGLQNVVGFSLSFRAGVGNAKGMSIAVQLLGKRDSLLLGGEQEMLA